MTEYREIVIIGAGASGLAVARKLHELGHDDVVNLEGESVAGGKCCTMHHDGRTYELGATFATPAYRRVRAITREHNVPWKLQLSCRFVEPETGRLAKRSYVPLEVGWRDLARVPGGTARVIVNDLHKQIARFPRLDAAPPDWFQSFGHWARQHDVVPVLEMLRPWATAYGYGFMDEVPAVYMLNYMCVLGPAFELPTTGFGGLWQRVAQKHDVRYDTRVERVARSNRGVSITTSRGAFEASRVVIACPFDNALEFLDASQEEQSLLGQVRTMDYQVVTMNTRHMPTSACVFIGENYGRDHASKPVFCYRRYADTGVISIYSYRGEDGLDGAEREARSLVQKMGGSVSQILARRAFRYFPHVSSESLAAGFYPRMEAMQGQNSTFYAGEAMSFACVEAVVSYAEQLAGRIVGREQVTPQDLPWTRVANDVFRQLTRRSA